MTLRQRVGRLEDRRAVKVKPKGLHVHYAEGDIKAQCPICRAMTDEEYECYLKHGDGRDVVEVVYADIGRKQ